MADAFFKGFGEGFLLVPQLIGSSVGLGPPPPLLTQLKTNPQVLAPVTEVLAPVTEVLAPILSIPSSNSSSSSGTGSSVVSNVSGGSADGTILGMDQTTALLVGGGVLLLLLLI